MRLTLKDFVVRPVIQTMLPAAVGLTAFVLVTGGRILDPRYVHWLFHGDPAQSFMGWHFFRHTGLLQFPLGANPEYGTTIGSSIVFSDSVPLFAFLFRPFDALLPDSFQYFGIWIALCFVLQAVFASKLLSLVTQNPWLRLLGSAFFAFAPVFLSRLNGHYALFGQWVLLAGLYLYLSKRFIPLRWVALLSVAALIHAYLLLMAIGFWMADLVQRRLRKQLTSTRLVGAMAVGAMATVAVMWLAGYFMVGDAGLAASDPWPYRMNLAAPLDPDVEWSNVLPDRSGGRGDYEGFAYPGLGMLVVTLIACWQWIRRPLSIDRTVVTPLLLLSLGLAIVALSPKIALGSHELWSYNLPSGVARVTDVFRAVGRFIWPAYYALYLAAFFLLFHSLTTRVAIGLTAVLLGVQIVDSADALNRLRRTFGDPPAWSSPLQSALWNEMGRHYRSITFVLPHNGPDHYFPFALLAASHGMTINVGQFARISSRAERLAREQVRSEILSNRLNPLSLYVFEDDSLWSVAVGQVKPPGAAGVLDGFRVVAPRLADCSPCARSAGSLMP